MPSAGVLSSHFICEGRPDLESTSPDDNGVWVPLGSPSRQFFFSDDKKSFPEARETCAALPGYGRLANLDLMFAEVTDWILDNHSDREYWVDAARPENINEDFQWGNGNPIDPSMWLFQTRASAFVARLRKNEGVVGLGDTTSYQDSKYYVCETEPEVTLEWRLLGSPQKLFGFSRTQSLGLQSAREACSRQLGDVTLANLDTHFDDVKQVILDNYPNDEFWVDATLPAGESDFQWGNGVVVNDSMWHFASPVLGEPQARMTNARTVALKTWSTADKDFHFICEGQPATPLDNYANATFFSCPNNTTITTESSEDTTVSTASPLAPCNLTTPSFNVSEEELLRILQSIRENLLLDKRNLSATIRKLTSADDDRPSAQTAGGFGIIFIVVVVAVVIFPDIISIGQFFDKKVHKMKKMKKIETERKRKDDGGDDVNDVIDDVSDIVDLDGDGGANSTNV
ncbi:uncharacterized protein [Littorina saxatilis]|uniref:uncharacterized protein n=1 Tax=Littorina saxatilis TaxID=31220 RepID=UPI0038B58C7E